MHADCPSESLFLDESNANVVNSSYFMEVNSSDLGGLNLDGDAWFTSLDVPDNIVSCGNALEDSGTGACPTTSSAPSSDPPPVTASGSSCSTSGGGDVDLSLVKVERSEGSAADTHVNVKCEVVGSEECDETSVDLNKMRLLVDKDNKENARLLLPNKNEGGAVVADAPSISENGDEILNTILNASEVCTIISEESARDSSVNSSCVLSSGSGEHGEVGSLLSEGIAKAIIDSSRTRTNPGGNNGQTLAMKSYTFSAPTLVRGRPSNGVVKRIGNGGNAKTVVVEEV
jgi:hypothetical protein